MSSSLKVIPKQSKQSQIKIIISSKFIMNPTSPILHFGKDIGILLATAGLF